MSIIAALIVAAIVSAVGGAATSAIQSSVNYKSTKDTNEQNIEMQRETNAQNQYNIEHAHQIEMADLKAAGLNPVLTAMGGSGAPIQALNAPRAQAPQIDLSGINSAMSGISQMATMMMMMSFKQDIMMERNATLSAIAKGHDSTSAANAALKASTQANAGKFMANNAEFFKNQIGFEEAIEQLAKQFGVSPLKMKQILKTKWAK